MPQPGMMTGERPAQEDQGTGIITTDPSDIITTESVYDAPRQERRPPEGTLDAVPPELTNRQVLLSRTQSVTDQGTRAEHRILRGNLPAGRGIRVGEGIELSDGQATGSVLRIDQDGQNYRITTTEGIYYLRPAEIEEINAGHDEGERPRDKLGAGSAPAPPRAKMPEMIETAQKMTSNLIKALQDEKREREIWKERRKRGWLAGWIYARKIRRDVDAAQDYMVSPKERDLVYKYCFNMVINQAGAGARADLERMISLSDREAIRLMGNIGLDLEADMPAFDPHLQDMTIEGRMARIEHAKPAGPVAFLSTLLGAGTRSGIAGAVGGAFGAATGGLFGWLWAREETAEVVQSGESWLIEIEAALASGEKAEIEAACHKIERLINDPQTRQEFFANRPRLEAIRLIERYQEGVRRLAMIRMSQTIAEKADQVRRDYEQELMTPEEYQKFVAEKYTELCKTMAESEDRLTRMYGSMYETALLREVGIIEWNQATGAGGTVIAQGAVGRGMYPGDQGARHEVMNAANLSFARRRNERNWIYFRGITLGASIGLVSGALGGVGGAAMAGILPGGALLGGLFGLGGYAADSIHRKREKEISGEIMGRWGRDWMPEMGPYGEIEKMAEEAKKREEEEAKAEKKKKKEKKPPVVEQWKQARQVYLWQRERWMGRDRKLSQEVSKIEDSIYNLRRKLIVGELLSQKQTEDLLGQGRDENQMSDTIFDLAFEKNQASIREREEQERKLQEEEEKEEEEEEADEEKEGKKPAKPAKKKKPKPTVKLKEIWRPRHLRDAADDLFEEMLHDWADQQGRDLAHYYRMINDRKAELAIVAEQRDRLRREIEGAEKEQLATVNLSLTFLRTPAEEKPEARELESRPLAGYEEKTSLAELGTFQTKSQADQLAEEFGKDENKNMVMWIMRSTEDPAKDAADILRREVYTETVRQICQQRTGHRDVARARREGALPADAERINVIMAWETNLEDVAHRIQDGRNIVFCLRPPLVMGMRDWNLNEMEKMRGKGGEEAQAERWIHDMEMQRRSRVYPEDVAGAFRQFIRNQVAATGRLEQLRGRPVKIVGVGQSFELDSMLVSTMRGDFTDTALSEIGGEIAQMGRVDIKVQDPPPEQGDRPRRNATIMYRGAQREFDLFEDIYEREAYGRFRDMKRDGVELPESAPGVDEEDEDDTPPAQPQRGGGGNRRDRDQDQGGGGRRGR